MTLLLQTIEHSIDESPDCITTAATPAVAFQNLAGIHLRPATLADLENINVVVAAAMRSWRLSERVIRLSLPLYRYAGEDLRHQQLLLAESETGNVVGVVALEAADAAETTGVRKPALLHGIYVDPAWQHMGVGSFLLDHAEHIARSGGYDGMLVKANPESIGFFETRNYQQLSVGDPARDYPYRFWKPLQQDHWPPLTTRE